jgi:hypothetical protein
MRQLGKKRDSAIEDMNTGVSQKQNFSKRAGRSCDDLFQNTGTLRVLYRLSLIFVRHCFRGNGCRDSGGHCIRRGAVVALEALAIPEI